MMAHATFFIYECLRAGSYFALEHPKGSKAWLLPFMGWLLTLPDIFLIELEQCAFGKRPSDWTAAQGDVRERKSSWVITNNRYLKPAIG